MVGAFYYIRIIKVMYFDDSDQALDSGMNADMRVIMGATAVVTLLFFIIPAPVVVLAGLAAETLFIK